VAEIPAVVILAQDKVAVTPAVAVLMMEIIHPVVATQAVEVIAENLVIQIQVHRAVVKQQAEGVATVTQPEVQVRGVVGKVTVGQEKAKTREVEMRMTEQMEILAVAVLMMEIIHLVVATRVAEIPAVVILAQDKVPINKLITMFI
jgi:hypothetical protein